MSFIRSVISHAHVATLALAAAGLLACGSGNGSGGDSGGPDAGGDTGAPAEVFNNCNEADFVDRTAASAERRVGFGGEVSSGPLAYNPRCLTVAPGQSVEFVGNFNTHPLQTGTAPTNTTAGSPNSPIEHMTTGTSATFTFNTAGVFPYHCEYHYAGGMTGVVRVR